MQNSMWMNLKSPPFKNQPKQIVTYILDSTQSRMSSMVLAIFNEWTASVKDYGHCILRIWMCMIFICGETWNNYMNFGGYIDLRLECLEITEGQQCAFIGHLAHEAETTMLSLNITHQMPNTAPHSKRKRTWTCHGICYICEKCALLLEDTFSSYSSMM